MEFTIEFKDKLELRYSIVNSIRNTGKFYYNLEKNSILGHLDFRNWYEFNKPTFIMNIKFSLLKYKKK